jgi:hypothetical protein
MCRGIQILNVALGGTLIQDVSLRPESVEHATDRGWKRWREVERVARGRSRGPGTSETSDFHRAREPPARRAGR